MTDDEPRNQIPLTPPAGEHGQSRSDQLESPAGPVRSGSVKSGSDTGDADTGDAGDQGGADASAEADASEVGASPGADASELSARELAEVRLYGHWQLGCELADVLLDLLALSLIALVIAPALDRGLAVWLPGTWQRLPVFLSLAILIHHVFSFPLSVFSGHILERRFGLSRLTFSGWLWRYAKRGVLSGAFAVLLFSGLFGLIRVSGSHWWWLTALATFVLSAVIGQLIPVLVLPLFYKVERLEDADLLARFRKLAAPASLAVEGIYRMEMSVETEKANAMLAGLGKTRRVILGDTLLRSFSPDEIEVVLAHEVGHHVFRHLGKFLIFGACSSGASAYLCDLALRGWLNSLAPGWSYQTLPVFSMSLILLVLTASSLLLSPLRNAISRRFEHQCDRYAVRTTGLPDAFVSAFQKLARQNKADPDPHWLEVWLLHDHPAIAERIRRAREWEGQH